MFGLLQNDRPLIITSLVVLVLAFLPTRWLIPWTGDLGAIIALPLTPLGHAAGSALALVRPADEEPLPDPDEVNRIIDERDAYRGRWHAARLQVEKLENELAQLQGARERGIGTDWTPRNAVVVRHQLGGGGGPLRLNLGLRQGVTEGTVAVVNGDRLVGRVAGDVAQLSSLLVPIGSINTDSRHDFQARILPSGGEELGADDGVRIHLHSNGDGQLVGMIEREPRARTTVRPGDEVRMGRDPAWPATAWAMLVGTVVSVESIDEQPLRQRVVVRRIVEPERLLGVTLKIQSSTNDSARRQTAIDTGDDS